MTSSKEVIGGIVGTSVSAVGTGMQTNELLQRISLILTIVGTLITIIMALVNWWKNAKKDGKITKDEINDAVNIIKDGADSVNEVVNKNKDKEEKK